MIGRKMDLDKTWEKDISFVIGLTVGVCGTYMVHNRT